MNTLSEWNSFICRGLTVCSMNERNMVLMNEQIGELSKGADTINKEPNGHSIIEGYSNVNEQFTG